MSRKTGWLNLLCRHTDRRLCSDSESAHVQDDKESFNDLQLSQYEYIKWLYYSGILKEFPTEMSFSKLSRTPAEVDASPSMGKHNEYVCTKILGMTDEEFISLINEGEFEQK